METLLHYYLLASAVLAGLTSCTPVLPNSTRDFQVDPADAGLIVPQLIAKHGYPIEVHHATTEDGYVLELHRIPSGQPGSPVVFLMHGLLCSSADWVIIGPGNALAYLLADRGYDVWLGNARGNRYSRRHTTYTPNMFAFWQFSWHEIGIYDLPAMIDYTLNQTSQTTLNYVGHSQGTTSFFVMTSTRPEYNAKIRLMQALAPVAFTEHIQSPLLKVMSQFQDSLTALFETFGVGEFLPTRAILRQIAQTFCTTTSIDHNLCLSVLFQLAGVSPDQVELQIIPIMLGHTPAGAATRQVVHYAQGMRSRQFRQYDHGKIKNQMVYGSAQPPVYNLTEIRVPMVFHYAANDFLAAPADVERLSGVLRNVVTLRKVEPETFNHLDFLIGKNVKRLLYDDVIEKVRLSGAK